MGRDHLVPLVINRPQEWLGGDDLAAQRSGGRIIQRHPRGERMSEQTTKKRGGQSDQPPSRRQACTQMRSMRSPLEKTLFILVTP